MKFYGEITKTETQDDGTLIVTGICSTENIDTDGEIVKASAIKEALPDFFKYGTGSLKEMHIAQTAAGVVNQVEVDEVTGVSTIVAKVVDPIAVKKVVEGVYKGFSIGGKMLKKVGNTIEALRLREISLVDRPANPEAVLLMYKGEEMSEEENLENEVSKVAERKDVSPKEGESKYGNVDFADEKNNKYPIDTEAHIRAAWNYINKPKNAGKYSEEDVKAIKAKIVSAWKKKIDPEGPPSATEKSESNSDMIKSYFGKEISDAKQAMMILEATAFLIMMEEEEEENDPEDKAQIALLMEVVTKLKEFITSELQEKTEEVEETEKAESNDNNVEKRGASISAANMSELQKMHDSLVAMGCKCNKEDDMGMAEKTEKSESFQKMEDSLQKMQSENNDLKKRLAALEDAPIYKASLKAVGRGEDIEKSDNSDKEPATVRDAIKQVFSRN